MQLDLEEKRKEERVIEYLESQGKKVEKITDLRGNEYYANTFGIDGFRVFKMPFSIRKDAEHISFESFVYEVESFSSNNKGRSYRAHVDLDSFVSFHVFSVYELRKESPLVRDAVSSMNSARGE